MTARILWAIPILALFVTCCLLPTPAPACCPAPKSGKPVVNADQTIIMIWDAAAKTQHFIRKASFKSDADDFGFIVPTPSQPELEESGNDAFGYLYDITKPEVINKERPSGGIACGCSSDEMKSTKSVKAEPGAVEVLASKEVAGFHAVVLKSETAAALVDWLKEHGYAYSPAVEAWAKPYVDNGWNFTALRVAKDQSAEEQKGVAASALRISFKSDRPVFPYREPDSKEFAEQLGAKNRLLRIYFVADARYKADLTSKTPWTVAWANKLTQEQRQRALELLSLPQTTGPEQWWLTEFEHSWPYELAPADVYFARDSDQGTVKREPIIRYVSARFPTDVSAAAIAAILVLPLLFRGARRFISRPGKRTSG